MNEWERMQRNVAQEMGNMQKSVVKGQREQQRSLAKENKAMQKGISKDFGISKEGRLRIPAKRRHEAEEKCHHKCHYPKCHHTQKSGIPMNIHHINMKNNDNRLSNLELLCANHHYLKHKKAFRRRTTTFDIMKGTQTRTRLIKKNKKVKKPRKKRQAKQINPFGNYKTNFYN